MNQNEIILKITPNKYNAKIIKNLYVGSYGETFVILQFMYFNYVLSNFKNCFYDVFKNILKTDISHHKTLGKCLVKLGENPTFIANNNTNFNTNKIEYYMGIKQILQYCILVKEQVVINYKIALNKINDINLKKIINNIILDEINHKENLQNLLNKYNNK